MMFGRSGAEAQRNFNILARSMAWICGAFLLLLSPAVHAQDVKVAATLDTANILIGQQAHLQLSVTYRVDQHSPKHITWPNITDTLTAKVPVLHDSHVDTILPDKQKDPYLFQQTRTLTITAWDSGYWAIPPFTFVIDSDSVSTNPLLLTVNTVEVDTTKGIRDINPETDWRFAVDGGWLVVHPQASLRVNNGMVMRDAAMAGLGLTLLPTFFVCNELESGALEQIDVGVEAEGAELFLAYPREGAVQAKLAALVDSLRLSFGEPPYWDSRAIAQHR